jgi:RNA polymerase sigma-70 factor (ECF subfamily)
MTRNQEEGFTANHEEFITEFARNSRRLYCYIRTLVPDRNDADDVYQNTSLVMWRKFDDFIAGSNFLAWGCQIAMFEVRKLRDSTKRSRLFSDAVLDVLSAESTARSDDTQQRLAAMSNCIKKLSPASRELIEQRYYYQRKPQELGSELGRSVASVYRSLAKTHTWLLACIERTLSKGV